MSIQKGIRAHGTCVRKPRMGRDFRRAFRGAARQAASPRKTIDYTAPDNYTRASLRGYFLQPGNRVRIISGKAKGRELRVLKGLHIRPPLTRVRQIIFSLLDDRVQGANVFDLFAGTGSLGLEALSRGARHAVFVDNSAQSVRVLNANIDSCRMADQSISLMLSAFHVFNSRKIAANAPYDIIFADPPYPLLEMERGLHRFVRLLDRLVEEGLLAPDGLIVARHPPGILPAGELERLEVVRTREAGDTEATFLKRKPPATS